MGPDPDRILLFGAGAVAGVGVTTNEVGLGGQIARALSAMNGRGSDVEIDGEPGRSLVQAIGELAGKDLSRYDGLIIQLGLREAVGLRSRRRWSRDIVALRRMLEASAPASLAVFFLGIPSLPSSIDVTASVRSLVERHRARLNWQSQELLANSRVQFLPFSPRDVPDARGFGGASTYAAWAQTIAVGVRGALDAATAGSHEAPVLDEDLRVQSLAELITVDDALDTRFDSIVGMARDLFGVPAAALNFIDRECQWTYAGAELPRGVIGREGTFCSVTISRDEILVVPDTDLDPRFTNHTNGEGDGRVRFYAGYPIEAPNGQRIGTLCIIDVVPRSFTEDDSSLLRELALRVQSTLWSTRSPSHTPSVPS